MNKKKEHNFIVFDAIIFVVTLLILAGCIFLLQKQLQIYRKTQNDITSITSTQQQNNQTISAFTKFKINSDDIANILPSQDTLITWIEQTETIASLSGVTQTITFNNGAQLTKDSIVVQSQVSSAGTLPIDIVVKGSYSQVLTYIKLLQQDYFDTKIDEISFSAIKVVSTASNGNTTQGAQSTNAVSATISLELFVSNIQTQLSH